MWHFERQGFPNETQDLFVLNDVSNVENCVVFCKKCVLQLQTECKADNVLAVLQIRSED